MADLIYSASGLAGHQSPRSYTREEIAAARRLKLIHGTEKHDSLGGPLYWATGPWYPEEISQSAKDYTLIADAIEREWGKKFT